MIRGPGAKAKLYTLQALNKVAGRRLDYWISTASRGRTSVTTRNQRETTLIGRILLP
jgi:hypothetical protein